MCNFTREIINPAAKTFVSLHVFGGPVGFLGGQWVFWGASGFSDSLAPRASGCHSPMSRPVRVWVRVRIWDRLRLQLGLLSRLLLGLVKS